MRKCEVDGKEAWFHYWGEYIELNKDGIKKTVFGIVEYEDGEIERVLPEKIRLLKEEKEDLYRWHDLENNPEDLPTSYEKCEVIYEYMHYSDERVRSELGHGYYIDNMDGSSGCWGGEVANGKDARCLAWRYIEPFKGLGGLRDEQKKR